MKNKVFIRCIFWLSFVLYLSPEMLLAQVGKVGINTTSPQAMLHVKDSSILFSGGVSIPLNPGPPPVSGQGVRMMWYPDKAAFRAGYALGEEWSRDSIGLNSFAAGRGTTAFGLGSVAMGTETKALAIYSTATGRYTKASGNHSTAMGYSTEASSFQSTSMGTGTKAGGHSSTAMGFYTTALGSLTTAMGDNTLAHGYASLVIGQYNDTLVAPQTSSSSTTPLFIIGNGVNSFSRSNALVVRRDGKTGLGTNTPANILDIEGSLAVGSTYSGQSAAPTNGAIIQGNTGIGTSAPMNKLDVEGGVAIGIAYSGSSFAPSNGAIIEGRVGIGTVITVNKLDVEGNFAVGSNFSGNSLAPSNGAIIEGRVGIGTSVPVNVLDVEGSAAIGSAYSGSSLAPSNGAIIQGNVGIGTSSPERRLHVTTGFSGAPSNSTTVGIFESASHAHVSLLAPADRERGIFFSLPGNSIHGAIVYNNGAVPGGMTFRTGGNQTRMTITGDGLVGLGTITPEQLLHVHNFSGNAAFQVNSADGDTSAVKIFEGTGFGFEFQYDGNGDQLHLWSRKFSGNEAIRMTWEKNGNVGIGNTSPSELLHVGTFTGDGIQIGSAEVIRDGGGNSLSFNAHLIPEVDNTRDLGSASNRWDDVWATNGVIQTSDARDKKNITELNNALDRILHLRPVKYQWKESPDHNIHLGLIAQEVQQILPEVIRATNIVTHEDGTQTEEPTNRLGINYASLIPVMIKALQEQQATINALKDTVDQQGLTISELLARVRDLEAVLINQNRSR